MNAPGRPRVLDGELIAEAIRLRGHGMMWVDIANRLGVHRETLREAMQRAALTPPPPGAPSIEVPEGDSEPVAAPQRPGAVPPEPAPAATKPWSATDEALKQIASEVDPTPDAEVAVVEDHLDAVGLPDWPPPPDAATRWIRVPTSLEPGSPTTRVRQVRFGQRSLYVTTDSRIWCDCCMSTFTLAECLRMERGKHRVSLDRTPLGWPRPTQDWPADRPPRHYW